MKGADIPREQIEAGIEAEEDHLRHLTILEAVEACGAWPRSLTSGIMFYKGYRITRGEFERVSQRREGRHP